MWDREAQSPAFASFGTGLKVTSSKRFVLEAVCNAQPNERDFISKHFKISEILVSLDSVPAI
jgi:hypothetical protein